jgi:NAD(P)-dependent dehydrogenase (short-subunit alcohol dehydrogenase family)
MTDFHKGTLAGRVALVTGSASGMGAATAILFARAGARVVVSDIDKAAGMRTAGSIRAAGGDAVFVGADVSNEPELAALIGEIATRYGRLDCAVNNAARRPDSRPIAEADLAEFDNVIAINLRSVLICMKYQFRQFLAQGGGGAIVNIGSVSSERARPDNAAYVASKHGVIGLTRTAALEGARHGIRANAVLPGAIDTPMLQASLASSGARAEDVAPRFSLTGRFGRPEEVAQASLWLCSDAASYVTGQSLAVDGGYLGR